MHRVKDLLLGIFPELPLNLVRMLVTCATIAIDVGSLQGLKVGGGELGNGVQVESQGLFARDSMKVALVLTWVLTFLLMTFLMGTIAT